MKKAFTILELLVVVAIIAILAVTATPSFIGRIEEANETAYLAEIDSVSKAAKEFYIDNSYYPTMQGDQPSLGDPKNIDFSKLVPAYLNKLPSFSYWYIDSIPKVYHSEESIESLVNKNSYNSYNGLNVPYETRFGKIIPLPPVNIGWEKTEEHPEAKSSYGETVEETTSPEPVNNLPIVSLSYITNNGVLNTTSAFTWDYMASDPDNDELTIEWSGDKRDVYTAPGEYVVTITVADSKGATASDSITLEIEEDMSTPSIMSDVRGTLTVAGTARTRHRDVVVDLDGNIHYIRAVVESASGGLYHSKQAKDGTVLKAESKLITANIQGINLDFVTTSIRAKLGSDGKIYVMYLNNIYPYNHMMSVINTDGTVHINNKTLITKKYTQYQYPLMAFHIEGGVMHTVFNDSAYQDSDQERYYYATYDLNGNVININTGGTYVDRIELKSSNNANFNISYCAVTDMIIKNNKIYFLANIHGNYAGEFKDNLYFWDIGSFTTSTVKASSTVFAAAASEYRYPSRMIMDKSGQIWIFTSRRYGGNFGTIQKIALDGSTVTTTNFPISSTPTSDYPLTVTNAGADIFYGYTTSTSFVYRMIE